MVNKRVKDACWLDRRHPQYADMVAHWQFVMESYRGGPGWFHKGNLPKYPSEHPDKYAHRLAGATRDNLTKEVVDQHGGYLFKRKPTRTTTNLKIEAFWGRAKRHAGDMDDLMAEADTISSLGGRAAIIIDKPNIVAVSAAEDKLPYAYTVGVLDLLDYAHDEDGLLDFVLTMERTRGKVNPMDPKSGCLVNQYRLRDRNGWSLWEKRDDEAVLIAEGTWNNDGSPFGRVPVVLVDHQDGCEDYAPPGLVDEIARLDRLISQEQTSLHEVVEWLGAPTLTFPGSVKDAPDAKPGTAALKLGVSGLITYPHDAANPPSYLTPDAAFIGVLQDRINSLIEKVRELASLPSKASVAQSGKAKEWDSQPLQARLSTKAANLQAAEDEVNSIVDLFNGGDGKPEKTSVQYPSTFDVTSLLDDITAATALDELPGKESPTYRIQLYKNIVRKSLPDLDVKTLKKIDEEIEANITAGDSAPQDGPEPQFDDHGNLIEQDQEQDQGATGPVDDQVPPNNKAEGEQEGG